MAFITLEDRLGEIEVIVFAKIYSRFKEEIYQDNAVIIQGKLSVEDNDEIKILASSLPDK